jgi:hypothetical protein
MRRTSVETRQSKSFDEILGLYLKDTRSNEELEVRFGTISNKFVRKDHFDRIIQYLLSVGFVAEGDPNQYILRVSMERSPVRIEIRGIDAIQRYCRNETIIQEVGGNVVLMNGVQLIRKSHKRDDTNQPIFPANVNEYNFRLSYDIELPVRMEEVNDIISQFSTSRKRYRHIKRLVLKHREYPELEVDCSVVKTAEGMGLTDDRVKLFKPTMRELRDTYEVEIEIQKQTIELSDYQKKYEKSTYMKHPVFLRVKQRLQKVIKYILSGWQNTNYPVKEIELDTIVNQYLAVVQGATNKRVRSSDFIGYSSVTLMTSHFKPVEEMSDKTATEKYKTLSQMVSIYNPYMVTDKADGTRKLMMIGKDGKMFFIDVNMNVEYTGVQLSSGLAERLKYTILDGEYIRYDKNGKYVNAYLVFDIYYNAGIDVRSYPFYLREEFLPLVAEELKRISKEKREDVIPEIERIVDAVIVGGGSDERGRKTDRTKKERSKSREPREKSREPREKSREPRERSKSREPRERPEKEIKLVETDTHKSKYRHAIMMDIVKHINREMLDMKKSGKSVANIIIKPKVFRFMYGAGVKYNVFEECSRMFDTIESGKIFVEYSPVVEYRTDGLIFTPAFTGICSNTIGEKPENSKQTWMSSFKWKPPEYNTIDFLVKNAKKDGRDIIGSEMVNGVLQNYKLCHLYVGQNSRQQVIMNAAKIVMDGDTEHTKQDNFQKSEYQTRQGTYEPVLFTPTNPPLEKAYECKIPLRDIGNGSLVMFAIDTIEENKNVSDADDVVEGEDAIMINRANVKVEEEPFDGETIVEFKYDINEAVSDWRWKPIRVRHEKTAEYHGQGTKNYGNAFFVANNVWSSIHQPVYESMLRSGKGFEFTDDDDAYYVRQDANRSKSMTIGLRDFHNLYVKQQLIYRISRPRNKLADIAVGKAGDLQKWIDGGIEFVLGLDVSKDNIHNPLDGAYVRYLGRKRADNIRLKALFGVADSGARITNGVALKDDMTRKMMDVLYAKGQYAREDEATRNAIINDLGKQMGSYYGYIKDGFNIVSCQFAFHYFWKSRETLHTALRNVSELCAVGGFFIGTTYDGSKVHKLLERKSIKQGQEYELYKEYKKIWGIVRQYSRDFENDETSIGCQIDVYQESIGQYIPEYLVNFEYLKQIIKSYGFDEISGEDVRGFRNSITPFSEMFGRMEREKDVEKYRNALLLKDETNPEREISFLNNAFIFKKTRNVSGEELDRIVNNYLNKVVVAPMKRKVQMREEVEERVIPTVRDMAEDVEEAVQAVSQVEKPLKSALKKTAKKSTKLVEAEPTKPVVVEPTVAKSSKKSTKTVVVEAVEPSKKSFVVEATKPTKSVAETKQGETTKKTRKVRIVTE